MMPKRLPYFAMWAFVALWMITVVLGVLEPFSHAGTLSAYGAIVCALFGAGTAMREAPDELAADHAGMWIGGIGVAIVALLLALITANGTWLRLGTLIGMPVAAVPVMFWLMRRFGKVDPAWAKIGIRSVGFFVGAAGVLIVLSIQRVWVSPFSVIFIPLGVAIFASHAFRALSDRNENVTLAGGWIAVCVVLWIAGLGLLGGLIALPGVQAEGGRLPAYGFSLALEHLVTWGLLAVGAACANQIAADSRGINARVTGLSALWLVLFGVLITALGIGIEPLARTGITASLTFNPTMPPEIAAAAEVLSQVYLPNAFDHFALVGRIAALVGVMVYAVQFYVRRPRGI